MLLYAESKSKFNENLFGEYWECNGRGLIIFNIPEFILRNSIYE
jgi:hypothetical protein